MQKYHQLEEARCGACRLAVVEVAKEVSEEALLVLVRLRRQVNIDNQVRRVACVLEAMVPPRLDGCLPIAAGLVGQHGKRLGIDTAVEPSRAGLDVEEFVLVDVVVERGFDDGDAVLLGRGRDTMRHDVIGAWRGKRHRGPTGFVNDGVVLGVVGPRRERRSKKRQHGSSVGEAPDPFALADGQRCVRMTCG